MAIPLETHAPGTLEKRSDRWVSSITLPAVLRYVPAATAIGVPISFLWAHTYATGYASYFGIPGGFVKVGPEAAVQPFLFLLALLTLAFMVIHEVEHYGVIGAPKIYGSIIRPLLFLYALGLYMVGFRRGELSLPLALFSAFLAWVLLWWLPPFITWGARQVAKGLGFVLGGVGRKASGPILAILRHIFRNVGELPPRSPTTMLKFVLIVVLCHVALVAPQWLGMMRGQGQVEFSVITDASRPSEKQAILAVYGDKAFLARVQGTTIRAVTMKQADDFKDMEIRSERLGELKLAK
jgi:hypothetical protein